MLSRKVLQNTKDSLELKVKSPQYPMAFAQERLLKHFSTRCVLFCGFKGSCEEFFFIYAPSMMTTVASEDLSFFSFHAITTVYKLPLMTNEVVRLFLISRFHAHDETASLTIDEAHWLADDTGRVV